MFFLYRLKAPAASAGFTSLLGFWAGGAAAPGGVTPTPTTTTTTPDPGGHRRSLENRFEEQRFLAIQERRAQRLAEAELAQQPVADIADAAPSRDEEKPKLSSVSPLPVVANFGAGPITIGLKLPPLSEQIATELEADDEDAIIAILLAALNR